MYKGYAGSLAYGTNLPTSDVDFRGIFCADPINVRTPFFPIREKVDSSEEDTKYYELANFMKLCLDCNPNIIELLWTDEKSIVYRTEAYDYLRSFREDFLSSKVAFTFSGYAMSQLKRTKTHHNRIQNYELKNLIKILKDALSKKLIDEDFIKRECGSEILKEVNKR